MALGWSVVYWVLQWPSAPQGVPVDGAAPAASDRAVPLDVRALTRFLGSDSAASVAPVVTPGSRMRLLGVVADPRGGGAAVIALEGQAARSYRVGSTVADGLVLQSVGPGRASLGADAHSGASVVLEVPRLGKAP